MSTHHHAEAGLVDGTGRLPTGDPTGRGGLWSDLGDALQWGLAGLAVLMLLAYRIYAPYQETIAEVVRVFLSIVLEALPFMLIGSLAGGIIEVFVSGEKLSALLGAGQGGAGRRRRVVLAAAAMGLIFPVCECAIVPVVRRLLRKGIPVSAAVAYLLAGPIVNPIVAASTLVAYRYDWRILAIRFGLGYGIAVGIGLLMGALFKDRNSLLAGSPPSPALPPQQSDAAEAGDDEHSHDHDHSDCDHSHEHEHGEDHAHVAPRAPLRARMGDALRHAADDFVDIGRFLVIGALIAGCLRGALNQDLFLSLARNPAVAIPAMMAFAFALTLCSEADAFVAASFRGLVPLSGQIAFLVLGPMLDVKLLLMYTKLLRKRALAVLMVSIVAGVMLAATACKFVLGIDGWRP